MSWAEIFHIGDKSLITKEDRGMSENFDILAELTGAVIGAATGILAEDIKGLAWKKIKEKRLIRKIRKREKYLKSKYDKSFELFNER